MNINDLYVLINDGFVIDNKVYSFDDALKAKENEDYEIVNLEDYISSVKEKAYEDGCSDTSLYA